MLKESGLTLVELTISLLISTSLILFATSSAIHIGEGLSHIKQQALLKNELRLLMQTVSIQLKRAGFIALPFNDVVNNNPQLVPPILISHHPTSPNSSCVLFAYDKNSDGQITTQLPAEHLGFRLHKNALEYRVDKKNCDQGGWHDMNNTKEIVVSKFSIQLYAVAELAHVYKIDLALESKFNPTLTVRQSLLLRVPNAI